MILSESVKIYVIPKILKYYLNKGYDTRVKNLLVLKFQI